jgi:uncharacterized damage-inducible protein DinB
MNAIANAVPDRQADREILLSLLASSRDRFLGGLGDVSEQQARVHPQEGRWSVLQTVEHLTVAEATMLRLLDEPRRSRPAGAQNREQAFLMAGADRSRKLQSPEGGLPSGRFATLAEAREHFSSIRAKAIQFVEENREDLRGFEVTHPHPVVGTVSIYELFILIARHADRHALQIAEIKSSPAFAAAETS